MPSSSNYVILEAEPDILTDDISKERKDDISSLKNKIRPRYSPVYDYWIDLVPSEALSEIRKLHKELGDRLEKFSNAPNYLRKRNEIYYACRALEKTTLYLKKLKCAACQVEDEFNNE